MEADKIERFAKTLLEQRKQLTGEYARVVGESGEEFGHGVPDINDEATRTMNRRILLEIGDKNYNVINEIDNALERIDDGGYGVCVECEEDIPEPRLELLPYTEHCVECKEKLEE